MTGGELFIRAAFDTGRILLREVKLSRPLLTRALTGMGEQEALTTIPLLYSVCREAQGRAAAAALARAMGDAPPSFATDRLWREMLHERLWRLCLDWPRVLQCSTAEADMLRQRFSVWRTHLHQPDCLTMANEILSNLAEILPDSSCVPLRDEAADIIRACREDRFYPFFSATPAPKRGRSVILTARGWLQHEVTLDENRKITAYTIHAPTDRHFANATPLVTRLADAAPRNLEEAKTMLERAILLLDPCVPWKTVWES